MQLLYLRKSASDDEKASMAQKSNNLLINQLDRILRDGELKERRRALVKLSRQNHCKRILYVFKRVMNEDPDSSMQFAARRLFNQWQREMETPKERILPPLFREGRFDSTKAAEIFDEDKQWKKLEALKLLAKKDDQEVLAFLKERLLEESDLFILSSMVKSVGKLGSSSELNIVQGFLKHEDSRVRANAVEALELIGDEVAWPVLTPLLNDESKRVRLNVAKTLEKFDTAEAKSLSEELCKDERPKERSRGLYFLEALAPPWAEDILFQVLKTEDSAELFERMVALLSSSGGEKSVSFLASAIEASPEGQRKELMQRHLHLLKERLKLKEERFIELKLAKLPSPQASNETARKRAPRIWKNVDGPKSSHHSLWQTLVLLIGIFSVLAYSIIGGYEKEKKPVQATIKETQGSIREKERKSESESESLERQVRARRRRREERKRRNEKRMSRVRRKTLSVGRRARKWEN